MDFGTDVRPQVLTLLSIHTYGQLKKGNPIIYICRQYKLVNAQNIPHLSTEQIYVAYSI